MIKSKSLQKLLSVVLSVLMIIVSLPFSNISAFATTATLSPDRFGMVGAGASRWVNNKFVIVNDREASNLSAGVLHYSLTPYENQYFSKVTFNVTLDTAIGDSEIDYINFYYSTNYIFSTYLDYQMGKWTSLSSPKVGSGKVGPNFIANSLDVEGKILYQTNTQGTTTVDVTDVFNTLMASGKKDLYIVIMHNKAGETAGNSGWSDTEITPSNINFTLEYSPITASQLRDDISSKLDSWNMPTGSQPVTYNGTTIGINSNVLYSNNTFADCNFDAIALNDKPNDTTINVKVMAAVGNIVYIYTKQGDEKYAKIPIIAETDRVSGCLKRYQLNYIYSPSNWSYDTYWYAPTKFSVWDIADVNGAFGKYVISADPSNDVTDFTSNTGGIDFDGGWNYDNIASYNGAVNFTNCYMKLPNPTFIMSFDGFCTWNGGSSAIDNVEKRNIPFADQAVAGYYLLDFSTMKDMYSRVKNEFLNVVANENKYTQETLFNYYKAVRRIVGYDATKGYDYQLESGPKASGKDMSLAINAYNSAYDGLVMKKYSIVIKYNNGSTTKTESILNVLHSTPFDEAMKDFDTGKIYNFCRWAEHPETIEENLNLTYIEHDNSVRELDAANKKIITHCSYCGSEQAPIQLDEYYAARANVEAEMTQTKKYTPLAIAKMQEALDNNTLTVETDTINTISDKITEMETVVTMINEAENANDYINGYNVKFVSVNDAEDEQYLEFEREEKYGSVVTFAGQDIPTPYKWVKEGEGERYAQDIDEVSVVITEDISLYAFFSDDTFTTSQRKVVLYNKSNRPVHIAYVGYRTKITYSNSVLQIGTQEVVIDEIPFYSIQGLMIGTTEVTDGGTYTVTKDVDIHPIYQPK